MSPVLQGGAVAQRGGVLGLHTAELVGHADLLRCMAEIASADLAQVAALFQFEYIPRRAKPAAVAVAEHVVAVSAEPGPALPALQPLSFWRVKHKERIFADETAPAWFQEAEPLREYSALEPVRRPAPRAKPLRPWSRLWPKLRLATGRQADNGALALTRLVAMLARGEMPEALPRFKQLRWNQRLCVLVDRRHALAPFWPDYAQLHARLRSWRGGASLEVHVLPNGSEDLGLPWERGALKIAPPGAAAILVLGDLGHYGEHLTDALRWRAWGRHWTAAGHACVVLTPCPLRLRPVAGNQNWKCLSWDRHANGRGAQPDAAAQGLEALLALLAPAVFVEPALLRAVRLLLPATWADAGSEWQFWHHPSLRGGASAVAWEADQQERRRQRFQTWLAREGGRAQAEQALALTHVHHGPCSPYVRAEEALLGQAWLAGRVPASSIMARAAKTLMSDSDFELLRPWARRWLLRQPAEMLEDERLVALAHGALGNDPLPGVVLKRPAWLLRDRQPKELVLRQCGDLLNLAEGVPLLRVRTRDDQLQWGERRYALDQLALPLGADQPDEISLRTDLEHWTLERCQRPRWARRFGRNRQHLFCEVDGRELIWLEPCELVVEGQSQRLVLADGRWIHRQLGERWLREGIRKPASADALGMDEYGVFLDFSIAVTKLFIVRRASWRMRLILPGSFLMGSPETEAERFFNELQHEVWLSRGCWLAETTVTQELWQAVMGGNPSAFTGENLPVESVSWDDVQAFIARLNALKPSMNLRLPTEAEWEYACRAGTTTPFHFGNQITSDKVNYAGRMTVEVKALPSNGWGLLQMHGNVWEWCSDIMGPYSDVVVDPQGPASGAERVLRGGGWGSRGRRVRAAFRDAFEPGGRGVDLGFRFARGPGL